MSIRILICFILGFAAQAHAISPAARALLDQAESAAGNSPQESLALLERVDKEVPEVETEAHFRKNILRCEVLIDNDDPRKALQVAKDSPDYSSAFPALSLKMQLCRAAALEATGDSLAAEMDLLKILTSSREQGLREIEGQAHLNLGQVLSFKNQFPASLDHLIAAKDIFTQLELPQKKRITLNSIAILYGRMGEHEKSLTYFQEVLKQNKALGKKRNIAVVLYNMGRRYEDLKQFDKASLHFKESLKIHREIKNEKSQAVVERALGGLYNSMGDPKKALIHLSNALSTLEKKGLLKSQAQLHLEMGKTYALLNKQADALASFAKAERLNDRSSSQQLSSDVLEARSWIYERSGQWKEAFQSLREFKNVSDGILKMKADEQFRRMNALFDLEKQEEANKVLTEKNRAQQRELLDAHRIQRLQLTTLSLAAILLTLTALFTIRQIRAARRMRELALTDELTKIPNRRHIMDFGLQTLSNCQRQKKPLSVVIFDIDHFKKVNDTFGHAVGDEVIKTVASISRNLLRKGDMVGRIGGEEFLVVLPFTKAESAQEVAERLRQEILKFNFASITPGLKVTVSVGVSSQDQLDSVTNLDHLIHEADEALYSVKQNGRNGVSLRLVS